MRHSDFAHVGENIWDHKYLLRMAIGEALMPEPLAERQARPWMAEHLRERGYGTAAG